MKVWCQELAAEDDSVEIICHWYNPRDLPAGVAFGWPSRWLDFIPMGLCIAQMAGKPSRVLRGALAWNGSGMDLPTAFECAYRDPMSWIIARNGGFAWENDLEFLRLLDLRYVALENIEGEGLTRQLDWDEEVGLVRCDPNYGNDVNVKGGTALPLTKWAQENRHGLDLLATWLRTEVGIVEPEAQAVGTDEVHLYDSE